MAIKAITAFRIEGERTLYDTVRSAREAEFDALMVGLARHLPGMDEDEAREMARKLRCGSYSTAADLFIAAANYLEKHRLVMTGAVRDPLDEPPDDFGPSKCTNAEPRCVPRFDAQEAQNAPPVESEGGEP